MAETLEYKALSPRAPTRKAARVSFVDGRGATCSNDGVDTGEWLELASAIGTIAAAVVAGIAAVIAAKATAASRELVAVERQRDAATFEADLWRQARRVTVDTRGRLLVDDDEAMWGTDVSCLVTNSSLDPISRVRIKITCGDDRWGPQLIGMLEPGATVEIIARVYTKSDDVNGHVRFVDVEGRGWVADSRTGVASDDEVDCWIEDGRAFATRDLSPHERGTIVRSDRRDMPDFDDWSAALEAGWESNP